jgi:O-acetyl-ADP-ribose deacetylase (regulator of RNase III)
VTINWEFKVGDLVRSDEPVLAHGCNTAGVMGAGIARQIREEIPEAFRAYQNEMPHALGSAQYVWTGTRSVFNLMTQRVPGPDARYGAITMAFANMAEIMFHQGLDRVAIPKIGAGIGGLDFEGDVVPAIELGLSLSDISGITIAVYTLPG